MSRSNAPLRISDDLALPIEAVTEAIGFLGRRGSGKTYAAQKIAEEMHRCGAQFVVIDPVGVWFSLRLDADGKSPGLSIPVLGGLHGDIPLEATGGALIADLVVDRGVSMILDVSQFESDADKARFAQAFADRFFFRKKSSPSAVHVFIEECQEFVPQNPQREETRMLHAFTRMAKIGRNFGIGLSLISQRPQEVNKKVLNLTELLFAFQLTGPQERKTIQGWIAEKGIDEDIAGELPKLEQGAPHVWSPAWLKISKVVKISRKNTFDASSTPKVGKDAVERDLAPIDLDRLRIDMAATIEKSKANDPKLLRKKIAEFERQLAQRAPQVSTTDVATGKAEYKSIEKRLTKTRAMLEAAMKFIVNINAQDFFGQSGEPLDEKKIEQAITSAVRQVAQQLDAKFDAQRVALEKWRGEGTKLLKGIEALLANGEVPINVTVRHNEPFTVQRAAPARRGSGEGDASVGNSGLRRILIALAQRGQSLTRRQLGVRAGLSSRSGTFDTYLSKARTNGWVNGKGALEITQTGLAALGSYEPLPHGDELAAYWLGQLGESGASRILKALLLAYPRPLTRTQLGEAANLSDRSGTFDTYLSRLRTLELIEGRGELRASEELFD